jgi:ATP-dependent Clp protease ATP-binding subunit ClpC
MTDPPPTGEPVSIPLADLFQRTLTLAEAEASALGHSYVGVEHLLLGLVRETSGPAQQLLTRHAITADAARAALHKRIPSSKSGSLQA